MNLYRVTYLVREGSRAYCLVKARDHREAMQIARHDHDDVIGVARADESEVEQKKGPGIGSVIAFVLLCGVVVGLGALVHFLRAAR